MGVLSSVIDAGREHRNELTDVESGLLVHARSRAATITRFFVLLLLSSVIAAGGVAGDSTAAIIGAMIMTPLATPLYGVALAGVLGSRRHLGRAVLLLVTGMAISVAIGALMALLSFERIPLDSNPQVIGRTAPTILDLVIAIAAGLAGAFALVRRDVTNILAGVAIAITLVPVLEVVGIAIGSGRSDLAWGALLLFLTNAAAIMLGGVVVFTAAGYERERREGPTAESRATRLVAAGLILALLVPLTLTSVKSYRYLSWTRATDSAVQQWVAGTAWRVADTYQTGDEIVAVVIGPGTPPPVARLRALVRRSVPSHVSVQLIESSGAKYDL